MRPIDDLREKIDLWKKSTTDTALMSVLHDVLIQIDAAIYEMDHQEAKARGARWRNRRMSDPIDRGDVLGVISCFFKDNDIDGLADLEREINRLDAASPWHKVEEELPDNTRDVLAVRRYGNDLEKQEVIVAHLSVIMEMKRGFDKWWNATNITHWMPFPEPPKEDA